MGTWASSVFASGLSTQLAVRGLFALELLMHDAEHRLDRHMLVLLIILNIIAWW